MDTVKVWSSLAPPAHVFAAIGSHGNQAAKLVFEVGYKLNKFWPVTGLTATKVNIKYSLVAVVPDVVYQVRDVFCNHINVWKFVCAMIRPWPTIPAFVITVIAYVDVYLEHIIRPVVVYFNYLHTLPF